ncbi:MAG: hypothetical protein M0Q53_04090 [Prolixibacteraceae bacterium]|jgi:hypothetical protein|nr:hypothetical protein [Prolixibacteraceae bacterium]
MRTKMILLTFISISLTMCNLTFLNHKDYKFKEKDFVWNTKIEELPGHVYVNDSKIIFGRNADSTFLLLSADNGAILETLKPFTVPEEKEYHRVFKIPVDKQKYSEAYLETIDRQFRGDEETYYLKVKTLSNKEFTILFSRGHFFSIQDITHFKDGKYIMTYNGEAGYDKKPYSIHVGLFDLGKIIKHK